MFDYIKEHPEWILLPLALFASPTAFRWLRKQHKESVLTDSYFGLHDNQKETLYRATVHNQLHELECPGTPQQLRRIVEEIRTREDRVELVRNWHRLYRQGKDDQLRARLNH